MKQIEEPGCTKTKQTGKQSGWREFKKLRWCKGIMVASNHATNIEERERERKSEIKIIHIQFRNPIKETVLLKLRIICMNQNSVADLISSTRLR